jgi:hypothetical protein
MIIVIIKFGRESSGQSLTNRAKSIKSTSYRQHAPHWQENWISCEAILIACDLYTHVLFELLRKIIARWSSEMSPTFKCSSIIMIMQDAVWYTVGLITLNQKIKSEICVLLGCSIQFILFFVLASLHSSFQRRADWCMQSQFSCFWPMISDTCITMNTAIICAVF